MLVLKVGRFEFHSFRYVNKEKTVVHRRIIFAHTRARRQRNWSSSGFNQIDVNVCEMSPCTQFRRVEMLLCRLFWPRLLLESGNIKKNRSPILAVESAGNEKKTNQSNVPGDVLATDDFVSRAFADFCRCILDDVRARYLIGHARYRDVHIRHRVVLARHLIVRTRYPVVYARYQVGRARCPVVHMWYRIVRAR